MELPVIGGVGDVRSPDSELLKDVDLRFQVPCGVVGLAEPGVALSDRDHVRHMRPCANRKISAAQAGFSYRSTCVILWLLP